MKLDKAAEVVLNAARDCMIMINEPELGETEQIDEACKALEDFLTKNVPDDYWGEDSAYPVADWQGEVENDDTRQGYWEWVESQRENDEAENNQPIQ